MCCADHEAWYWYCQRHHARAFQQQHNINVDNVSKRCYIFTVTVSVQEEHFPYFGPDETNCAFVRDFNVTIPTGCTRTHVVCYIVGYPASLQCISCMTPVSDRQCTLLHLLRIRNMPARSAIRAGSINTLRHYGPGGQSASHMGPHTAVEPHAVMPTPLTWNCDNHLLAPTSAPRNKLFDRL